MTRLGNWLVARWWGVAAWLAVLLGMKQRALELYEQILAREPHSRIARATVGNLQAELGDKRAAIATFTELVARHPKDADSWFNLGFLHEACDEVEPAERAFRRAIALDDKLDRAWSGLGLVLIRTGRLEEAIPVLKKNTELQPFSPYGFYQLGMTYHHLGRSGDAWRTVETLKKFEPRYAATLKRDLENTRSRSADGGAAPFAAAPLDPTSHRLEKEAIATPI